MPNQRRVVARRKFEAFRIHDRDVRVEQRHAEPDSLDLGGDPVPFFRLDRVIVDIFVVGDAIDSHATLNDLRLAEVVIWLDLGDLLQGPNAEGSQLADPGGGSQPEVAKSQFRVGGNLEERLDVTVVDHFKLRCGDPWLIEDDFLGVGEPGPGEIDFKLGSALPSEGANPGEARRSAKSGAGEANQGKERSGQVGFHGRAIGEAVGLGRLKTRNV